MKTSIKSLVRALLAILLMAVGAVNSLAEGTNSLPSGNDEVRDLLRRATAATAPPKGYSATVHHTVKHTIAAASPLSPTAQKEVLAEEDYAVRSNSTGGVRTTARLSSRQAAQRQPAGPGKAPTKGGLVTVNPLEALKQVAAMQAVELADDSWHGAPCRRVTGNGEHYGFVVWVDRKESSVRRVLLHSGPKVLYDVSVDYKQWNGGLVPAHVEITRPSRGITMIQDFSGHTF